MNADLRLSVFIRGLSDCPAVNDHDLAVHKTIPLTHHEGRVLSELFGATEATG